MIPLLCPQVSMEMGGPREPRMLQCVSLMACHRGGDGSIVKYTPAFFIWLDCQIIMIEDYPYAGMNYIGDPSIPLPIGMQWLFCVFSIFLFFFF